MNCPMCGHAMETIAVDEEHTYYWCHNCGARNVPAENGFFAPWLAYEEFYPRGSEPGGAPEQHYTNRRTDEHRT